jgi:hypothetical protein
MRLRTPPAAGIHHVGSPKNDLGGRGHRRPPCRAPRPIRDGAIVGQIIARFIGYELARREITIVADSTLDQDVSLSAMVRTLGDAINMTNQPLDRYKGNINQPIQQE